MKIRESLTKRKVHIEKLSNLKKVILYSFLTVGLLVAPIAINSHADDPVPVGDFKYTIDTVNQTATLVDYTNPDPDNHNVAIEIPRKVTIESIDYNVTAIGQDAFNGNKDITSVTFESPSNVKSIEANAFSGCSNLVSVYIPSGVTSLGASAFRGCSKLTSVDVPGGVERIDGMVFAYTGLEEVNISSSVTSIGSGAFGYCTGLRNVTFEDTQQSPSKLEEIGGMAFGYCKSLTNITIPSNVETISENAFYACGLTSVNIPPKVKSIGCGAFACQGLSGDESTVVFGATLDAITVDSNNNYFSAEDGVLYDKNKTILKCYPTGKTGSLFTIPSSVQSIESMAFAVCPNLTGVNIPSSVTSIGNYAFAVCSGLTSVNISSGVTSIGDGVFQGCSSLTSVAIPKNVESVGGGAFNECTHLESVFVPGGLDVSSAYIPDGADIWRYRESDSQAGAPTGKTLVDITSNDNGSSGTNSIACNAMGSGYVIHAVPQGINLTHLTEYEYTWGENHSSCTAISKCSCGAVVGESVNAENISSIVTTEPTSNSNGVKTYTAKFPANSGIPDAYDTEELPMIVDLVGDGENPQRSHDILGYQAEGTMIYEASVYWDKDMTFVYDRGTYGADGNLACSFAPMDVMLNNKETNKDAYDPISDQYTNEFVEKGETAGNLSKWYGFDGFRNRILVLNRSNAAITAKYETSAPQGGAVGEAGLELYDYAANAYDANDNTKNGYKVTLLQAADNAHNLAIGDPGFEYGTETSVLYPAYNANARFGNGTKLVYSGNDKNNVMTLPAADWENGYMYANKIFFNITGNPGNGIPADGVLSAGKQQTASIGTITITFAPVV